MPAIVTRRGRRSTLMLPTPPGMDDIAAAREKKFDEWLRGTGDTDATAEGYPTVESALEGVELDGDGEEGDMHLGEELDEEELERDLAGESRPDEEEAFEDTVMTS